MLTHSNVHWSTGVDLIVEDAISPLIGVNMSCKNDWHLQNGIQRRLFCWGLCRWNTERQPFTDLKFFSRCKSAKLAYSLIQGSKICLGPRQVQEESHRAEQGQLHTCTAVAPRPGRYIWPVNTIISSLKLKSPYSNWGTPTDINLLFLQNLEVLGQRRDLMTHSQNKPKSKLALGPHIEQSFFKLSMQKLRDYQSRPLSYTNLQ